MSESAQSTSTKVMKIILWIGAGLTILVGILSFISGGSDTNITQNDTFQSQETNPFK